VRETQLLLLHESLEDRVAPVLLQGRSQVHFFEDLPVVADLLQRARDDLWVLQGDASSSRSLRVSDLGPDSSYQAD
jgi:hypothetical protein